MNINNGIVMKDMLFSEVMEGLRREFSSDESYNILSRAVFNNVTHVGNDIIITREESDTKFLVYGEEGHMLLLFGNIINREKEIGIKYFSNKIEELRLIDNKSDWIDLRSAVDITLKAGEHKLIPLGVGMVLPTGYEAHIVPRSSTFKNWGIIQTNHMGVIDESYCGDNDQWMMSVYATRDTEIKINDRICQFRIVKKQPPIKFNKVDHLMSTDRGGFGSTGKQ